MASVHIPMSSVPSDSKALLDEVRHHSSLIIDGERELFQIVRVPLRTAADILRTMESDPDAYVELDEDWAADMQEIVASRTFDKDPWAG